MRRIVVIAHKTLGGQALLEEVGRGMRGGDCRVHVLVPMVHPMGTFTEASCRADAQRVLEEGMRRIRQLDPTGSIDVTGEVGDPNPVYAAQTIVNRGEGFDEIVVSTLREGLSRWLLGDVPKRLARTFPSVPVTHVLGAEEPAPTG